jgi:hypothetical protein
VLATGLVTACAVAGCSIRGGHHPRTTATTTTGVTATTTTSPCPRRPPPTTTTTWSRLPTTTGTGRILLVTLTVVAYPCPPGGGSGAPARLAAGTACMTNYAITCVDLVDGTATLGNQGLGLLTVQPADPALWCESKTYVLSPIGGSDINREDTTLNCYRS